MYKKSVIKNQKSKMISCLLLVAMFLTTTCKKEVRVTGVTLDRNEVTLTLDETQMLRATVHPSDATEKIVFWTSERPEFVTVADGMITGVAVTSSSGPGIPVRVSTQEGNFEDVCYVTVRYASVTGVTLNKAALTLAVGESETLTVTVVPQNANQTISWESINSSVAEVSQNGTVIARESGMTTITVTTTDGNRVATCHVTVTGLPALTTSAPSAVTGTSATLGGNITNAGTPAYTERGVVYSTSPNPTTTENKTVISGTGTGNFSATVSGLNFNTTYYVRAYATNSVGTAYGEEVNFIAVVSPALTTTAPNAITATGATLGGNITNAGMPAYIERGVVYSTYPNPTIDNNKTVISGTGTGNFSAAISGLTGSTTYYVRAYAISSASTVYGNEASFTTLGLPTLTTNSVTTFTGTTATFGGNITSVGNPPYTERGVAISTTPNPTTADFVMPITGTGTGNFSRGITGLSPETTYYLRAYAINTVGTAYGNEVIFTTPESGLPKLTTNQVSISGGRVTAGGNITHAGSPPYTERGVVWAFSPTIPTIENNNKLVISGTGTGNFSGMLPNELFSVWQKTRKRHQFRQIHAHQYPKDD